MSVIKKQRVTKLQSEYVKQHERNEVSASRRRKLLIRRLAMFFVLASVISYFMISTLISQASSLEEIKAEQQQLNEELAGLKKKEMILKEEIVKLNDDEYIAKLARKDYFLSEEGEVIFNISEEKEEKSSE
ncbi:septum formation initiator family protein [Robertmurraya sp. DFI.2.37]|jgi:cell division protein DivIC|uniref:FtsB family cell division protein n=1 Tax=Robertmurraya sp. DFI.2.37 TaxID=3031819 RepID=UPI0012460680|nr:septum formation initiator family protein [Robertmurraya sp. DFI.2.37]MDF1509533.1 septum formation initiator family protein [Robertmurraya sp. DFI.2.37]